MVTQLTKFALCCRARLDSLKAFQQIGTYNAAVLAARHKIPFIVVAPVSTVDLDIANGTR